MGQSRPVQVYLLITTGTLEENLLATLAAKHELSSAAVDFDSEIDQVDLVSGMEELKRRLEISLGAKPEASVDQSQQQQAEQQQQLADQRERVNLAGGQLVEAAFQFIGQMLPTESSSAQTEQLTDHLLEQFERSIETDAQNRPTLKLTFPDQSSLRNIAESMARLMEATNKT